MATVLGVCPRCGSNILTGKYGPYCSGKCGFKADSKLYGKELTDEQVSALLSGEEILLSDLTSKNGDPYDLYVRAIDVMESTYTGKDGKKHTNYKFKYKTVFPDLDVGYNNFFGYFRNQ